MAVEIKQRLLGPREEARIAIALEASATKIQENVDQGKAVRRDDLFQETPGSRSAAEEIAEGTLLAAQREYEERKVPYQGRLLGNILFHPEINQAEANHLIRLAQDLSYRRRWQSCPWTRGQTSDKS